MKKPSFAVLPTNSPGESLFRVYMTPALNSPTVSVLMPTELAHWLQHLAASTLLPLDVFKNAKRYLFHGSHEQAMIWTWTHSKTKVKDEPPPIILEMAYRHAGMRLIYGDRISLWPNGAISVHDPKTFDEQATLFTD